jgi:hypothetical protein
MGQGAVRSQMDVRISFRVRERKDVDLILGQGMLAAGWHAHTLNAPGKFPVAAEHDTPKRARAYLITDQAVTSTAATYAGFRPPLDAVSCKPSIKTIGQNDFRPPSSPPPYPQTTAKTSTTRQRSRSGPHSWSLHPREPRCPNSWQRPA